MKGELLGFKTSEISKAFVDEKIKELKVERHINMKGFAFRKFVDVNNQLPFYLSISIAYYYEETNMVRIMVAHSDFMVGEEIYGLEEFEENLFYFEN